MTTRAAAGPATRHVRAGARATYVTFASLGFCGATWSSRLAQVSTRMHLDPASLGLLLLVAAAGGVVVLPLSGRLVARAGPRRAVTGLACLVGTSLGAIALAYAVRGTTLLTAGLYLLGTATALWDVAVAVHGTTVERRLGRSMMPRFFAAFSLGTVMGALVGVTMVAWRVSVPVHFATVAAAVVVVTPAAARSFLPDTEAHPTVSRSAVPRRSAASAAPHQTGRRRPGAWREPRIVLLGLTAAAFAVAEGAGGNWIAITVVDAHRATAAVGGMAYTAFSASLTVGRWLGPVAVDRFGRAASLRAAAVVAGAGLAVFGLVPGVAAAFSGAILWGAGAALGFPVSVSAAADRPGAAAYRVGAVTCIGYGGFLGGPALIGFIGQRASVAHALLLPAALLAASLPLAGAARSSLGTAGAPLEPDVPAQRASGTFQGEPPCSAPTR